MDALVTLRRKLVLATALAVVVGLPAFSGVTHVGAAKASVRTLGRHAGFNGRGNLLITDQYNNRVIELNPKTNIIVWSFGSGDPTKCNPGPGAIIGPNDAERLSGGLTLMAGTGVPSGASPTAPSFACVDNRVIVVNHAGHIVWQYGRAGVTGSGANQLNVPVFAIQLPDRDIMIVDQGNNRVIVVDRFTRTVVWSYGPASGPGALNNPNSAELLPNGHVLIADENNNRIIEVTHSGHIVWQYGSGDPKVTTPLQTAAFASRLPDGHTLITDAGHSRVLEINRKKGVIWQYFTNKAPHSNPAPQPTNAVRLESPRACLARHLDSCRISAVRGIRTLISDQNNDRVIVVSGAGKLLYQYGMTNVPGNGAGQLDGPYTAYSIGDYTGQTPPPHKF
jgi:hypothetical protein